MTELKQIYKCEVCGNIIEVLHTGIGELVCCGKPMVLKKEDDGPADYEKHAPVIEKTEKSVKVKVGATEHPMQKDHYIEWIELIVDGKYARRFLTPADKPEAEFCMTGEKIKARMYCNIHGLWKSK
ncbi:MAG TPA: desulfoferrodoxin [Candidatus Woesearchaeota archaeon]|nr:desulfoferrodoxin [Candidatus Woesearchaeota archaeon]